MLGYNKNESLIRFAGEEALPEPKENDIVVFKSFFWAGLRLSMHMMVTEVLKKYGIYIHQMTTNAIVS